MPGAEVGSALSIGVDTVRRLTGASIGDTTIGRLKGAGKNLHPLGCGSMPKVLLLGELGL